MKISCIALDLDRTTLNSQGRLSETTKKTIKRAIASGIQIVVASGRALRSLPEELLEIEGIRYAITSNGAAVYDLRTRECLKEYRLTSASVEEILRRTEKLGVAYEAFIDGKPYGQKEYVKDPVRFGATPASVPYVQRTRQPVENIREFILSNKERLNSLDVVVKDEETKEKIWADLKQNVPDLYITSSIIQLLEISYKDCGKHSGARFLLDYLGIPQQELAAFGDGDNDAELLRFAGLGIAVANASPGCQAAADEITLSNDEDGVARAIEKILDGNAGKANIPAYPKGT